MPLSYGSIIERGKGSSAMFRDVIAHVPYETKGILNSEMLFLLSCLPNDFSGRMLESGRARAQSTLVLALALPTTQTISIELNKNSPDVPVAAERLKDKANVTQEFGNAEVLLPAMLRQGDAVLIDGPKMFRAVRLALRLLATGKPIGIAIHDMNPGMPERTFLSFFLPETLFSDALVWAKEFSSLDEDPVQRGSTHARLAAVQGEFGYGFSLAYIPHNRTRWYRLLLAISYPFDACGRVLRKLRLIPPAV